MRAVVALMLLAALGRDVTHDAHPLARASLPRDVRLAGLSDSAAGLFVRLVNERIQGRIDPRAIHVEAPAGLTLEDVVLSDPEGAPVARVGRARVRLSLSALFSGELAISELVVDEPRLVLEKKDGQLNLIRALTPVKEPDKDKPADTQFRIDRIVVTRAGFRYLDGENLTVVTDGIDATGRFEMDLANDLLLVDLSTVRARSGSVRLPELDAPFADVQAQRVRLLSRRVDLSHVVGRALGTTTNAGGRFDLSGNVDLRDRGALSLAGRVTTEAGAWPGRLQAPTFTIPAIDAHIAIDGPFDAPVVSVDGDYGPTRIAEIPLDGGHARVDVTKARVRLFEGTTARSGRGTVRVSGDIALDDVVLDLRARASDLALQTALSPAKLDEPARGVVQANAHITGTAGKKLDLVVDGTLDGDGVELYGVRPGTHLDGSYRISVTRDRVGLKRFELRGRGVEARVQGDVDLEGEQLKLDVDVTAENATRMIASIPDAVVDRGLSRFDGVVQGRFKEVVVRGTLDVEEGDAYVVPLRDLHARLAASGKEVRIESIEGFAARGRARLLRPLVIPVADKKKPWSGRLEVDAFDLGALHRDDGSPLPLRGRAHAVADFFGRPDKPLIDVRVAGGGVVVANEPLGDVTGLVRATREHVLFRDVQTRSPLLRAHASQLLLTTDDLTLTGVVDVERIDVSALVHAPSLRLRGVGRGVLRASGVVDAPTLQADLSVRGLAMAGHLLGDGAVSVGLLPEHPARGSDEPGHIATLAARVHGDTGAWDARLSWAIEREVLASDVTLDGVDLRTLVGDNAGVAPMDGLLSGTIRLQGPLDELSGTMRLRMPDLVVTPARLPADAGATAARDARTQPVAGTARNDDTPPPLRAMGTVLWDGTLDRGTLSSRVCAFPRRVVVDEGSPCTGAHRLWATVQGDVHVQRGAYRLHIDGALGEGRLHELLPALAARDVALDAAARVVVDIDVPEQGDTRLSVDGTLQRMRARTTGAPEVELAAPVHVQWRDSRLVIGGGDAPGPARFATRAHDVDVQIAAGSVVGTDEIDLRLDGTLALAILKLLTREVANAEGTAQTALHVVGRYADGVRIEGTLTPTPGARITPRSLGDSVVFQSGGITFTPASADPHQLTIDFSPPCPGRAASTCPLKASVGEGAVALRGQLDIRTSRSADSDTWLQRFDLGVTANGVSVRVGDAGRLETSFELALTGAAPAPLLSGHVDISDGSLRRDFQIRNFVLSAEPDKPSDPLAITLRPYGLDEMAFDVELSMQNVRTRARINAFSVDASLRGDLQLTHSLRLPVLDGAIEVEDGLVDFPRARFDILETQAQFPTSTEGRIRPVLHLLARAEIPPGLAGNEVEFPVDLTIDGTLEQMQLDLSATSSERQWTRTELFSLILFGTAPNDGFAATSVDVARRAAIRELAAPITSELESLAAQRLGVDVHLDATNFELQLGRRLVVEGGLLDLGALSSTDTASSTAATTSSSNPDALRVRLLFFDHLSVGRSFSAEGRIGATSDLRLSWRLFEE